MQQAAKVPQMVKDTEGVWHATGHHSFIGWEIIKAVEEFPGIVRVQVERKRAGHVIGQEKTERVVISSAEFVPIGMYIPGPLWKAGDRRYYTERK